MILKEQKSKFLRVKCDDCGNEQVIFNHAKTIVKCLVCDKVLAIPKGGLAEINSKVIEIFD
ncbi:MAG: 30S ribosomal protein S27e [Candidatus Altiarchaeota archaeon]